MRVRGVTSWLRRQIHLGKDPTVTKGVFVSCDDADEVQWQSLWAARDERKSASTACYEPVFSVCMGSSVAESSKQDRTARIAKFDCFLVIVGASTAINKRVEEDIEYAKQSGVKLVAVRIDPDHLPPAGLLHCGTSWALRFDEASIVAALTRIRRTRCWSRTFEDVLQAELNRVGDETAVDNSDPISRANAKQLVGLALSGGGIRSATFNLGVLQSLARLNLLPKFDYLSTVSGGGYIGSWLLAWMRREGVKDVHAGLRPEWGQQPGHTEPTQIHFLRRFSNYLTPKLGWLGADLWTVIAIYIRNLVLNLAMLGSALAFVLLMPRWIAVLSFAGARHRPIWHLVAIGGSCLVIATWAIVRSMRYFTEGARRAGVAGDVEENIEEKGVAGEAKEKIEEKPDWTDEEGNVVDLANASTGAAWYREEFDDFVLTLEFYIKRTSVGSVYVWTPATLGTGEEKPDIGAAVAIRVSSPTALLGDQTGTIERSSESKHLPGRRAEVLAEWNELEITCAQEMCEVRVNGVTVNKVRVERPLSRVFLNLRRATRPLGMIGLDPAGGGVKFRNVKVVQIESPSNYGGRHGQVQRRIIAPLFIASFVGTLLFGYVREAETRGVTNVWSLEISALVAGGISALLVLLMRLGFGLRRGDFTKKGRAETPLGIQLADISFETFSIGLAAAIGGILARTLYYVFYRARVLEATAWGTPALIGVFLAVMIVNIGLLGRRLPDQRREWWSRLNAWLLIYAFAWSAIFATAFYAPHIVNWMSGATTTISLAWLFSTISGLIAARSAATGKKQASRFVEVTAKVAPYVFILGFFFFLSWSIYEVDAALVRVLNDLKISLSALNTDEISLLILTSGTAAIAALLSWRLDINQFSMHMLYRNRLGRCYLGASNRLRRAQPFTGFSVDDDLTLSSLAHLDFQGASAAPYPIVNATLNLVAGNELAWQQRKAASFVFTPLYCGYEFPELPPGYCETNEFASVPSGITLATAMAISGAAASPNMGYHTSPAAAFLMTVFNVRLGWWLGNPRQEEGYKKSGPLNVLSSLMLELFGLTSDRGKYIYLSDGGHFENLGIYELVRRRCRFIVASDAEEDRTFGFSGLGNAIEKCRSDFGIDIDIDVEPIRVAVEKGYTRWHCAIGTIHYGRADGNASDGILVYFKASLTGDEPTDVLRYASANPEFPHQTTGDQWFDESQFESYRVLGFHVAENVFGAAGDVTELLKLSKEQLFVDLAQAWYPPSAATADAFTKHTRTTVAIYDELRENKNLEFLSQHIYPEWRVFLNKSGLLWSQTPKFAFDTNKTIREQLPQSEDELRAGFYICNSVFQLFEDAYVDLNLEAEHDHPDNRGWMNLFKHWSWAPMFRVAWTISASNYGARFQNFCSKHLALRIGRLHTWPPVEWASDDKALGSAEIKANEKISTAAGKVAGAIRTWLTKLPAGSSAMVQAERRVRQEAPGGEIDLHVTEDVALARTMDSIYEALGQRKEKYFKLRREHTDEEWTAAAALFAMSGRQWSDEAADRATQRRKAWANDVAELALSRGAVITTRVLNSNFQNAFNPVERELIELFLVFNPTLAASAQILKLDITPDADVLPDSDARRRERDLYFPFGFAILAAMDISAPGGASRMVYFRVQDHLRRMGLARQALEQIIGRDHTLLIDVKEMHPEAREVPTERDRARFFRLFASVKNAVRQKKPAPDAGAATG